MPTYHYQCDACGAEFEKEQRISEAPAKKCAKCGKNKARRMIVSGNFILKGGGWYSDGYGTPAASSSGESASEKTESDASKPADKKSADKPAASASEST